MKRDKNRNTVFQIVKFWVFEKVGIPFIRVLIINKSRIIGSKDYSITQIDPITLLNHIFKPKLENAIMEKNVSLLFFDFNNGDPLEIDEKTFKISLGKGSTNKDLSINIDQKIMSKLFSLTPIFEIIPILISAACLGGILYLIMIMSNIIQ